MPELWERQEYDTPKSYAGFLIYRELPLIAEPGQDTRRLETVAKRLGHNFPSTVFLWSNKYHWVERALAYDDYRKNTSLAVKDVALLQYQKQVVQRLTTNLTAYYQIVEKTIKDYMKSGEAVTPRSILTLGQAIRLADDLARRAGGMPVDYVREAVKPENYEEMTYTVEDES